VRIVNLAQIACPMFVRCLPEVSPAPALRHAWRSHAPGIRGARAQRNKSPWPTR
jgi:hypothetical protein